MNSEIEASNRRVTVIADPHIHASGNYSVFKEGMLLEQVNQMDEFKSEYEDNLFSIFVKRPNQTIPYVASSWPGRSAWIDFLNENA